MADHLSISKGWDGLPDTHHTAAVISYRGKDVWYFERRRVFHELEEDDDEVLPGLESEQELDDEYRAIKFPDALNNEEMLAYAIMFVHQQGLENRFDAYDPVSNVIDPMYAFLN